MRRHLLAIADLSIDEIRALLDLAVDLKAAWRSGTAGTPLAGRILALLFEQPSLRTRVSFEVAMQHLGGQALYMSPQEVQLGRRETIPDAARVLSRYVDAIVLRTVGHDRIVELAEHASVPVINGLSDQEHPCQALADLLTVREHRGALSGLRLAWVGDGNNVCNSLMLAAAKTGMRVAVACPPAYRPKPEVVAAAQEAARLTGGEVAVFADPREAVRSADVVYTDAWISMGQERESAERRTAFAGFQINAQLMELAGDAVVMHCLPAHRGEEISADVLEGPDSIVWDQAENRVHAQKAVLHRLLRGS
ncbi:MAG TPA: ornithine carbamoyltransferase [Chloroflexota bacterium]